MTKTKVAPFYLEHGVLLQPLLCSLVYLFSPPFIACNCVYDL